MLPRLMVALRDEHGVVRSGGADLPALPQPFTGAITVHFGNGYPSAIDVHAKATTLERPSRRALDGLPLDRT